MGVGGRHVVSYDCDCASYKVLRRTLADEVGEEEGDVEGRGRYQTVWPLQNAPEKPDEMVRVLAA